MLTATRSCEIDEQQFVVAKSIARNRHERLLQTVQFVPKASCQNCSRFADVYERFKNYFVKNTSKRLKKYIVYCLKYLINQIR